MSEYVIPDEYYFRIHHVRPRFKGDIENVLIYMAERISEIGEKSTEDFVNEINSAIYRYPGNAHRELKTINNWRTEISALFGFIEKDEYNSKPGLRAIELAEHQDLIECFKIFLYTFQYPGAHIKPKNVLEQVEAGIHFKPAQYILQVLREANKTGGNHIGLTKPEICHCIFNDLRVTRDNEGAAATWSRIRTNRKNKFTYDQTGDVIRYAGDIVDYLEIANLLKTYDSRTYYLNTLEEETIIKFIESTEWFSEYDTMIQNRAGSLSAVKDCVSGWYSYVNRKLDDTDFTTDLLSLLGENDAAVQATLSNLVAPVPEEVKREQELEFRIGEQFDEFTTKDIGDIGEALVHGHECMRIKLAGREDLIHLIKRIPTQYAVGYDILSVETDERKRCIEVKTTISAKPLHFNTVHLTKNEWNAANTYRNSYYIYRLMISKSEKKLFLLQNPVGLYKNDEIEMIPANGAEIRFDPKAVGTFEELLTWGNIQ